MAFKGFLKSLANDVVNEFGKEVERRVTGGSGGGGGSAGGSSSGGGGVDLSLIQGVLGMLSGKGGGGGGGGFGGGGGSGGSGGFQQVLGILNSIQQQYGGQLPGNVGKYLPYVLKVAEIIGHGMGDDSPRTERNPDGSFIDGFIKTIIGGRKIFGGGDKKFKPAKGGGTLPTPRTPSSYDDADYGDVEAAQDFEQIRAQCLEEGALFEDPDFPAEDASVFFSNEGRRHFQWLRPHEICGDDPQFFIEGATRFDVNQGELGDCWLLAALANLTLNEQMLHQVVPLDNSFEEGQYAGVFHFRFWQYGRWVDVVVDDRLPTVNGKLMFLHSDDRNEFWSPLLEKAYAKLHGSYEALKGGTTCEALEDFTGGVTEMYDLQKAPDILLEMMQKAFERNSFLGCSIEPDPNEWEAKTSMGLVRGHAYSITAVKMLDIETPRLRGKIPLLRVKNPWGNEVEWRGAWSDCSKEWQFIDDDTKEEIGLVFEADGEFWISYKDFLQHFDRVEMCNLSPDSLEEDEGKKWHMSIFEGAWRAGVSAGGCRNYLETFSTNPQYIIELPDPDENDPEDKCTILVALMQKNRRSRRNEGVECLTIGFAIYKLPSDEEVELPLSRDFFKYNASVARSPTFINLREVCSRFRLPIGRYLIVPSTFEPNDEGDFLIRVFTEGQSEMMEGPTN